MKFIFVNLVILSLVVVFKTADDFGLELLTQMKDDANLDLSRDEEYEDLRAEFLAYHTMLAKLSSSALDHMNTRRSLRIIPCWQLGGICVNYRLCEGSRYLTEVNGCKDHLMVCCFTWNRFRPRDLSSIGIPNSAYPWASKNQEYGAGRGVVDQIIIKTERPPKKKIAVHKDILRDAEIEEESIESNENPVDALISSRI